ARSCAARISSATAESADDVCSAAGVAAGWSSPAGVQADNVSSTATAARSANSAVRIEGAAAVAARGRRLMSATLPRVTALRLGRWSQPEGAHDVGDERPERLSAVGDGVLLLGGDLGGGHVAADGNEDRVV